jgi:hypothetical protein
MQKAVPVPTYDLINKQQKQKKHESSFALIVTTHTHNHAHRSASPTGFLVATMQHAVLLLAQRRNRTPGN